MSQQRFPLAGLASDGSSTASSATATCYCGSIQLSFPLTKPGFVGSFICNCSDCRKITASMFASNIIIQTDKVTHVRGQDLLTKFEQNQTIASGLRMANHFCSKCGTLMYRIGEGFPGNSILRLGTVDDFELHETVLKPSVEQYTKDRVAWLCEKGAKGVEQVQGSYFTGKAPSNEENL